MHLCSQADACEQEILIIFKEVIIMKDWGNCDAVQRNPDKVSGAWVFCGTRVPVSSLFENIKDGASIEQFLEWFPGVKRSQVEAVLDFEVTTLADSDS
jgi:uncharacterized protein (DUF433 family)